MLQRMRMHSVNSVARLMKVMHLRSLLTVRHINMGSACSAGRWRADAPHGALRVGRPLPCQSFFLSPSSLASAAASAFSVDVAWASSPTNLRGSSERAQLHRWHVATQTMVHTR